MTATATPQIPGLVPVRTNMRNQAVRPRACAQKPATVAKDGPALGAEGDSRSGAIITGTAPLDAVSETSAGCLVMPIDTDGVHGAGWSAWDYLSTGKIRCQVR